MDGTPSSPSINCSIKPGSRDSVELNRSDVYVMRFCRYRLFERGVRVPSPEAQFYVMCIRSKNRTVPNANHATDKSMLSILLHGIILVTLMHNTCERVFVYAAAIYTTV